jgi:putative membrane protein (TIGR04086 family)
MMNNNINQKHPLLTGLLYAFLTTFILLCIFSISLAFTNLTEINAHPIANTIIILSAFIGSFKGAKLAESKILYLGVFLGIFYWLIILCLSLLFGDTISYSYLILKLLYCIAGGIIGGLVGITFK